MAASDITDALLELADFATIREVSANLNTARIIPYVREAQRIEMQQFLGPELYYAFVIDQTTLGTDFGTAIYQNLWDGATYTSGSGTVYCHGLKLTLTYFAYARMLKNSDLNVTAYGARVLSDGDLSERERLEQIRTKVREAYSTGFIYQSECDKFIGANSASFPLYSPNPKTMSQHFIKIA